MRADPNKYHVPTAADAAKWYALATVAAQIASGASKAWHELDRLSQACETVTVFGVLNANNPCVQLGINAYAAAHSVTPHKYDQALSDWADAVKSAYYDWEAGRRV